MTSGAPDFRPRIITSAPSDEQIKIAVTAADSSGNFTQQVQSILMYNDGPNTVHYNRDAASTTDKIKLPAKAWLIIDVPITTPHFICAAGGTATVYCVGVY